MTEKYFPCEFCDTDLPQEERLVTLTLRRNGKLYVFEGVPAQVCPNCGHRYYDGPMITKLEQSIRDNALTGAQPIEAYQIQYSSPD